MAARNFSEDSGTLWNWQLIHLATSSSAAVTRASCEEWTRSPAPLERWRVFYRGVSADTAERAVRRLLRDCRTSASPSMDNRTCTLPTLETIAFGWYISLPRELQLRRV